MGVIVDDGWADAEVGGVWQGMRWVKLRVSLATSGAPDRAQGLALPSRAPATLGRLGLVGGCSPNELQSPSAGMASERPPPRRFLGSGCLDYQTPFSLFLWLKVCPSLLAIIYEMGRHFS